MFRFIFVTIIILFSYSTGFAELSFLSDKNEAQYIKSNKADFDSVYIETIKKYLNPQEEETAATKQNIKYRQTKKVVMYSSKSCGYCRKAKSLFKKYNIKYTNYDIVSSKKARRKFKALKGKGVPLIYIGKERISGFNEQAIKNALGIK